VGEAAASLTHAQRDFKASVARQPRSAAKFYSIPRVFKGESCSAP